MGRPLGRTASRRWRARPRPRSGAREDSARASRTPANRRDSVLITAPPSRRLRPLAPSTCMPACGRRGRGTRRTMRPRDFRCRRRESPASESAGLVADESASCPVFRCRPEEGPDRGGASARGAPGESPASAARSPPDGGRQRLQGPRQVTIGQELQQSVLAAPPDWIDPRHHGLSRRGRPDLGAPGAGLPVRLDELPANERTEVSQERRPVHAQPLRQRPHRHRLEPGRGDEDRDLRRAEPVRPQKRIRALADGPGGSTQGEADAARHLAELGGRGLLAHGGCVYTPRESVRQRPRRRRETARRRRGRLGGPASRAPGAPPVSVVSS